ncbi:prepilin-type N-terminal cleavage/methylation domain-containing protein [Fibrobacter sp. UWOV1]|uniref:type IV pilin protein n=1 Tax=Fibrobacter sp. UWOV1 TaxID=1896215 RepID=UPI00091FCDF5|nr:type II secretion system protein [Fibrobacter sp. UWOV1]SHL87837.1 prepilin-type N-terminal cleavage/methylation domain-containing protein [Fibrobacter sp. UWOV1]
MKKQGFTLIELMVVIVIMGILAAVAVPKLFGMIAKSKASEVGPAAGTYVKLQQAFVSETGENYGNFKIIGYSAPGKNSATTNFTYSDQGQYTNNTATLNTSAKETWRATANLKLNDCNSGSYWKISVAKASNGSAADAVVFTADINGTGCEELTPSYKKIGK